MGAQCTQQNSSLGTRCEIALGWIPTGLHWWETNNGSGAIRQHAITWANVEPDLCRHMASLVHNEFRDWSTGRAPRENIKSRFRDLRCDKFKEATYIHCNICAANPPKKWFLYTEYTSGLMMTSSNGNIFCVTGPLCGEFTGHRWIPHTKASNAELWCFLSFVPE